MMSRVFFLFLCLAGQYALAQTPLESTQPPVKTYRVGIFNSPPLSSLNEQGEPEGLVVDLLSEIALQEGFAIEWVFDDWSVIHDFIRNRKLDMLTSVGFTESRSAYMDYSSESLITVWSQVFLADNSTIENIFDLEAKRVGILRNGVNGANFLRQCQEFEVDCQTIELDDYQDIFRRLETGELDAGVSNNLVGYSYLDEYNVISSSIVFNPFKAYVTIPKYNDRELLDIFDRYMNEWKADPDSYYYQTRLKWLKPEVENELPELVLYLILGLLAFSITAMGFVYLLNQQVKRRVYQLSRRQQQMKQIVNLVPHMIYVADTNGKVILANKTAGDYFGMSVEEFENSNVTELYEEKKRYRTLLDDAINISGNINKPTHKEIQTKDYYGNEHILFLSKMPFLGRQDKEPAMVTVAVDITDAKKFEEKIKFMAQHDSLTDLPNRMLLKDRIDHSLALSKQHHHNGAILFIDLDYFKNINDSQGHRVGDMLLKDVAQRLNGCVRPGDTIARLGGDEFIVALSELNNDEEEAEQEAIAIGEQILAVLAEPYELNSSIYHMSASIGMVLYPRDGTTQETLLQRADTAMYEAKANGRNRIHLFTQKLESLVIRKLELETELRQAVDKHQLFIAYQPVVKGESATMVGSEALLRWNHPSKGIIYPGDFIEIAEQKNLIVNIGDWVLEEVCKQIRYWLDEGRRDFFIAANLSVKQLKDEDFYDKVANLIHIYKIPKDHLELEVTESVLMKETKRATHIFKKLKLLGVRVSIDDFGTGYSSFNYLIKLPLDKIKIDQSFVKNLPGDANSATIVTTILRMARELDMDVVAEGIETVEQFDFLLGEQCHYFQGFYFHRPVSCEELVKIGIG